jgi:hypothetical protein
MVVKVTGRVCDLHLIFVEIPEAKGADLHLICGKDNRLRVVDRHLTFWADGEGLHLTCGERLEVKSKDLHLTCCEDHAWGRVMTSI